MSKVSVFDMNGKQVAELKFSEVFSEIRQTEVLLLLWLFGWKRGGEGKEWAIRFKLGCWRGI
jgi:hypothetical protein